MNVKVVPRVRRFGEVDGKDVILPSELLSRDNLRIYGDTLLNPLLTIENLRFCLHHQRLREYH